MKNKKIILEGSNKPNKTPRKERFLCQINNKKKKKKKNPVMLGLFARGVDDLFTAGTNVYRLRIGCIKYEHEHSMKILKLFFLFKNNHQIINFTFFKLMHQQFHNRASKNSFKAYDYIEIILKIINTILPLSKYVNSKFICFLHKLCNIRQKMTDITIM